METMSVFFEYLFCLIDVLLLDKLCSINFECKRSRECLKFCVNRKHQEEAEVVAAFSLF